MEDDRGTVQRLLRAAGFDPPDEDIAALAREYPQTRAMADLLFTVEETDDELPALAFQVDPRHREWT
jgi:hypothetical protein